MTDFATLVLGAESKDLRTAAGDLDKVTKKSGEAERGASRLTAGMKTLAVAAAGAAAAFVSFQSASVAIRGAREFSKAVSEASTLIEGTPAQIKALETASKDLAATYGGTATQQVQGFYQAISAGAGSVEEAAALLDVANKLAVGGVTDTTTAVDALTTATNAYAATGLTAAQASDALFVGIKAGKTTAGELGSALGNVVPIAASLGVSFDEIVAGTAALTTQGQTTSVAVNGLRQILAAVVKPTSEAVDAAEELGIAFDTQGLRAKGLSGFLEDVIAKTGGSEAALAQLFGSVEALNAVLSFSGGGGAAFTATLEDMAEKAGATDAAFNKMAEDLDQRLNVVLADLGNAALRVGTAMLSAIVPAMEAGVGAVQALADNSDILASILIGLAATTIPATVTAIASLTAGASLWSAAFTTAAVATAGLSAAMGVLRTAVSLAGGPIGVLIGLLTSAASYALLFRDDTDQLTLAVYDAEAGAIALNNALKLFSDTAAPAAGKAAIAVANDNYAQADSAYEAAKAELAKARAMLAFPNMRGRNDRNAERAAREAEIEAVAELQAAEAALQRAMADRKRAVTAITGSVYDQTDAVEETVVEVRKLRDATGDAFRKTTEEQRKLHDAELAHREALQVALVKTADFWKDVYADVADNLKDLDERLSAPGEDISRSIVQGLTSGDLDSAFKDLGRRAGSAFVDTLFSGQSLGTTFTKITTGIQGAVSGVQSAVSGVTSLLSGAGGISGAFAGIGGALAGIGGALAAALPVIGGVLAAVNLIGAFSKTKVIGAGITGELGPDTEAFNFVRKKKSSFFGLTSSKSTKKDANIRATNVLSDARDIVLQEVEALANGLGGTARDVSGITQKFRIDTRDMSTEEVERVLTAEIEKYQNRIALAALGTRKFTKLGETSSETLNRLSGSLAAFNGVAELLGTTTLPETLRQANKASEILESVGGANAFSSAADTYFTSFLDLDEQITQLSKSLVERAGDLGLNSAEIDTRGELTAFVKSRGSGAAGAEQQVAAISLAPLVDQIENLQNAADTAAQAVANQVEEERFALEGRLLTSQGNTTALRQRELDTLNEANRSIQEHIFALQDQATAAAAAAEQYRSDVAIYERYLSVAGREEELRARQLSQLSEYEQGVQRAIWAVQDQSAATEAASAEFRENTAIYERYLSAAGKEGELRERQLAGLSQYQQGVQLAIWQIEDNNAVIAEQQAVLQTSTALYERYLSVAGKEEELRARQIASLTEYQQGVQLAIWAEEDRQRIDQQRLPLEQQILQLEGRTADLRARELELLDSSNRGLQSRIFQLEDEAAIRLEIDGLSLRLLQAQGAEAAILSQERAALLSEEAKSLFDQIQATEAAAQAESDLADARRDALGTIEEFEFATIVDKRRARADVLAGRDAVFSSSASGQHGDQLQRLTEAMTQLGSEMRVISRNTNRTASNTRDQLAFIA